MKNIEKIAVHYGLLHQLGKTIEELDELRRAIFGILKGSDTLEHLQEEIADVKIMLAQIQFLLGQDSVVADYEVKKISRQLGRIEKEEMNNGD